METLYNLLIGLAPYTHFISFGLLMLAGLNFPVPEDLVFIVSAAIAATIIPENSVLIFTGCLLGAYFSDIVAYSIGRIFGRKILKLRFFSKMIPTKTLLKVENYFHKYGGKTLFFGRFIPFGVRNVIFMSAGIGKMKIKKFLILDLLALSITSSILFSIGYTFGSNYVDLQPYLKQYKFIIFSLFLVIIIVFLVKRYVTRKGSIVIAKSLDECS